MMRSSAAVRFAMLTAVMLALATVMPGCDAFERQPPAPDPVVVQPEALPGVQAPVPQPVGVAVATDEAAVLDAAQAVNEARAAVARSIGELPPDDPRGATLRQWVASLDSAAAAVATIPPVAAATGPPDATISGAAAPLVPFLGPWAPIGVAVLGAAGIFERDWRRRQEQKAKDAEQARSARILRGVRNVVASVDSMRKNLVMNAEPANAQAIDQLVKTSLKEAQTAEGGALVEWAKGASTPV